MHASSSTGEKLSSLCNFPSPADGRSGRMYGKSSTRVAPSPEEHTVPITKPVCETSHSSQDYLQRDLRESWSRNAWSFLTEAMSMGKCAAANKTKGNKSLVSETKKKYKKQDCRCEMYKIKNNNNQNQGNSKDKQ